MAGVTVAPYSPLWPRQFGEVHSAVAGAFAPLDIEVEHVGSTSVPGLVAKPVIDVLLGAASLAEVEGRIEALAAMGYAYVSRYELEIPRAATSSKPLVMRRACTFMRWCAALGFGASSWRFVTGCVRIPACALDMRRSSCVWRSSLHRTSRLTRRQRRHSFTPCLRRGARRADQCLVHGRDGRPAPDVTIGVNVDAAHRQLDRPRGAAGTPARAACRARCLGCAPAGAGLARPGSSPGSGSRAPDWQS